MNFSEKKHLYKRINGFSVVTIVFLIAQFFTVQLFATQSLFAQNPLKSSNIINDNDAPAYTLTLPIVEVYKNNEDPAYAIMRRAIAAAPHNRALLSVYEADVYSKATLKIDRIPRLLKYASKYSDELKKLREGDVYTQEQLMQITSSKEKLKCVVLSRKSSFPKEFDGDMSSDFVFINPYQNAGEIISPLTPQGFSTYKFRLQNILTRADGRTVYRISLIPRIKSPFAFFGTLDILDSLWCVVAFDFNGTIDLQMINAKYSIKQNFNEIAPRIWMPNKAFITVNASMMGIKATMSMTAGTTVTKYMQNTDIASNATSDATSKATAAAIAPKTISKKSQEKLNRIDKKLEEISQKENISTRDAIKIVSLIEEKSVLRSGKKGIEDLEIKHRSYNREKKYKNTDSDTFASEWNEARENLPLNEEEKTSYDKAAVETAAEAAKAAAKANKTDTAAPAKNNKKGISFRTFNSLFERHDKKRKIDFEIYSLRNMFTYNPVAGFQLSPGFFISKKFKNEIIFRNDIQVGYAFASKQIPFYLASKITYSPKHQGYVKLDGGMCHSDFNTTDPIHPYHVAWGAILGHRNYSQYYNRAYITLTHSIEIFNGFDTRIALSYEWRQRQMHNNTEWSMFFGEHSWLFHNDRKYQQNIPLNNAVSDENLAGGRAALLDISLRYTPRRHYRFEGKHKIALYSDYPTFSLKWRKGIAGIVGSSTDFDYLQLSINQTIHKTMLHTFRYKIFGGYFPNNRQMHFSEFSHPSLMGTAFLDEWFGYYQVLRTGNAETTAGGTVGGNYRASTNKWIAGAHLNYDAMYLIFKWLPYLNKTLIRENIYLNYLETPYVRNYFEAGYSINRILMFVDIGVAVAFESRNNAGFGYSGWRLHLRLKL
ncbi:MAG: DUF5686 family protein [Bacteroidales bacterium]|jgi:hypothetical protein|nr:DUF5686 family protein [Bacteroidales bacterium]